MTTIEITAAELADRYGGTWGEHPDHPAGDWQDEVTAGNSRSGYWEWVLQRLQDAIEDDDCDPGADDGDHESGLASAYGPED